jgi:hypothetical protein
MAPPRAPEPRSNRPYQPRALKRYIKTISTVRNDPDFKFPPLLFSTSSAKRYVLSVAGAYKTLRRLIPKSLQPRLSALRDIRLDLAPATEHAIFSLDTLSEMNALLFETLDSLGFPSYK